MSNFRTTTELTTSGAIVNREEVKVQSSNVTLAKANVNIPTKIDLRNQMREMSEKDRYDRNYRLFIMLPFTIALFLSFYHPYVSTVIYLKLAVIIYAAFLVLLVFAIIIRGAFLKKPLKKYANQLFGFESSNGTDTDSDVLYQFEQRQYAGLCVLISILYSSVMTIINETYERNNHHLNITSEARSAALTTNILCLVFHKTVKCNERITEEKKSILEKYKNTKTIQDNIDQRLHDWQKSKKLFVDCTRNRIAECIGIWLCIFCLAVYGIWDVQVFGDSDVLTVALQTVFFSIDSVFLTCGIYFFHTIYLHFKFPAIIMDELAASINAQTMADLIGWWELRKFYSYCIIRHYSSAFATIVGIATLAFIIFLIVCTAQVIEAIYISISVFLTCYFASFAFSVVSNATQYHSNQLSHKNMICQESMALEKYRLDALALASDHIYQLEARKYEMQHYIVNQMIQDIQNNSDVLCVLGIAINANFMLLLRAASGTAAIAMISIVFS